MMLGERYIDLTVLFFIGLFVIGMALIANEDRKENAYRRRCERAECPAGSNPVLETGPQCLCVLREPAVMPPEQAP